jgi:hypothetical protein
LFFQGQGFFLENPDIFWVYLRIDYYRCNERINIILDNRYRVGELMMLIEGPLKIGVLDQSDQPGRELHIDFTPEFQALAPANQVQTFAQYLNELDQGIASLPEDDPNRAGMLIVQQIVEQLSPHVANGDLELTETIIVEMGRDFSSDSLMSLLNA